MIRPTLPQQLLHGEILQIQHAGFLQLSEFDASTTLVGAVSQFAAVDFVISQREVEVILLTIIFCRCSQHALRLCRRQVRQAHDL